MVAPWVKGMVEDVMGGPPVKVGHHYLHPDDGEIIILGGRYWGDHGLSNSWTWDVVATGERKSGYAGDWPEVNETQGKDTIDNSE